MNDTLTAGNRVHNGYRLSACVIIVCAVHGHTMSALCALVRSARMCARLYAMRAVFTCGPMRAGVDDARVVCVVMEY